MPSPLTVVTVQAGDRYPDLYVDRLRRMVGRHLARPHRMVVYADGARRFEADVEVRDCTAWDLEGWFNKLRLFDRAVTGEEPFLYLDHTLVIRGDLQRLIAQAAASAASLVAVDDWNYPVVNSCVLWVRPDANTQRVWDEFGPGGRHRDMPGDQNVIDAVFREHSPEALEFWAEGVVASYKHLRKRAVREPQRARAELERCAILKFHGRPKPHEVLRPWRRPSATCLRHPLRPRLWRYLAEEIRTHWR